MRCRASIRCFALVLTVAAAALVSAGASAAVVVSNDSYHTGNQTIFGQDVSALDLLQTSVAGRIETGYTPYTGFASTAEPLSDESIGTSTGGNTTAVADFADSVFTVEYNFTAARDIAMIRAFTGHQDNRVSQKYTISIKTASNPVYTSLGTFASAAWSGGTDQANRLTITQNDGTGLIAGDVTAIKFDVLVPPNGNGSVYREWDVIAPGTRIQTSDYSSGSQSAYASMLQSGSLIQNGAASLAGHTSSGYVAAGGCAASTSPLTDGVHGGDTGTGGDNTVGVFSNSAYTETYFLDGNYAIDKIALFAAHYDNRSSIGFDLAVRYPGDASFTSLGHFVGTNHSPGGGGQAGYFILEGAGGLPFLSAVNALRFVFGTPPNGNGSVYRELQVFGTAVPEPGTLALLAAGAVGLLFVVRRKSSHPRS
jgi:hypothetical protein